jgi:uncharacterized RDD family membrane protein YckC
MDYSGDKLIIETPEQTALEFPLAGIGSRFVAVLIDYLLQAGFFIVLAIMGTLVGTELGRIFSGTRNWFAAGIVFIFFAIQFGYFAVFESLWNGQTPGKRWTHLRVIKDSGRPIAPNEAILRNLLRIIDMLPTLYATGIICVLISKENKRVGDYAAGTVVVHEEPITAADSPPWAAPAAKPQVLSMAATQLTVEELDLIDSYFQRRGGLEPHVRWGIARQLADRFGQRLNVAPEARPDSEQFLQVLAEQRRGMRF